MDKLLTAASCPPDMVNIENQYCIDRFESSLTYVTDEYELDLWSPFHIPPEDATKFYAVSMPSVVPQGYISGAQAAIACRNSGKRLCKTKEWVKACQGPQSTLFPYGNAFVDGACNHSAKTHPLERYYGKDKIGWERKELTNPGINQQSDTLAPTGTHPLCANAYGVYDMVGNLHEWVDDPNGTFLGEFYIRIFHKEKMPGCRYYTTAHPFSYEDYSTGFRCCAIIKE